MMLASFTKYDCPAAVYGDTLVGGSPSSACTAVGLLFVPIGIVNELALEVTPSLNVGLLGSVLPLTYGSAVFVLTVPAAEISALKVASPRAQMPPSENTGPLKFIVAPGSISMFRL